MRKIILMMSVSLDGFFEGPDRDISWHLVNEELHRYLNEQFREMGAFMFGRVTYWTSSLPCILCVRARPRSSGHWRP
jgi:dihydrofolate reductase